MMTTLGQIAFEAYNKDRGGVNHQGNKTPDWADLPEEIQHAWEVGADEVAIELMHVFVGRRSLIATRTVLVELTDAERAACSGNSTELPKYQRKVMSDDGAFTVKVHALKILKVNQEDGGRVTLVVEAPFSDITVTDMWRAAWNPLPGGYYVLLEGSKMYEQAVAFESLYGRAPQ